MMIFLSVKVLFPILGARGLGSPQQVFLTDSLEVLMPFLVHIRFCGRFRYVVGVSHATRIQSGTIKENIVGEFKVESLWGTLIGY